MPIPENYSAKTLPDCIGFDFGQSAPVVLDQDRINRFADATGDQQWIHVDPDRAAKDSPFGGTIAHGFLTLSLIAAKHLELGVYPKDAKQIFNYGLEGVRFLAPVPAGSIARVATQISGVEDKGGNRFVVRTQNEVLIEGSDKPAVVAEMIAYVMA